MIPEKSWGFEFISAEYNCQNHLVLSSDKF
jgi:hypothetical protein